MAQINITKTDVLNTPSAGLTAIGVKSSNELFLVDETGTEIPVTPANTITGLGIENRGARFISENEVLAGGLIDKGFEVNHRGKGDRDGNSIFGEFAYADNTTGDLNCAFGLLTLAKNTTGNFNSIFGAFAGEKIVNGSFNAALGTGALNALVSNNGNSAFGNNALKSTLASVNTAMGLGCLEMNTSGGANTAIGNNALRLNTTGTGNSALGAGTNSGNFSNSVILGRNATATDSNQFVAGSAGTIAGAVVAEINTSSNVWNVVINGVARKILLA